MKKINQSAGERNFHIFYHLLYGESPKTLQKLGLLSKETNKTLEPSYFEYLKHSKCFEVNQIADNDLYKEVIDCFKNIGMTGEEISSIKKILASILHIGNIYFDNQSLTDTMPCGILNLTINILKFNLI